MPNIDDQIYEIAVIQSHNGKNFANVFAIRDTNPPNDNDTLAGFVADAWTATNSFADCQVQDIGYEQVNVRVADGTAPGTVTPWPASQDKGSVVGDPVDPGSCLGFTLGTGLGGRSGRGRLYLGGVARSALDAFSTSWDFTTSPGSTFKNASQVFAAELDSNAIEMVVISRFANKAKRPTPIYNVVTSWTAKTSILSQNPRARRYGSL